MTEFSFVPVPIGRYRTTAFPDLDADEQASRIAELAEGIGGLEEPWTEAGLRDRSAVDGRLGSWARPPAPRSSLLYWAGHGQALGPKAWLATADSPDPMTEGAVNPESFAEYVISEWRRRSADEEAWALVVIEACGAKRFVEAMLSCLYAEGSMDRLAVIGVAGYGAGYLGDFQRVLSDALAGYSDNDEAIHLRDLVGRIQDRLGDRGMVGDLGLYRAAPLPRRRRLTGPVTAPLDVYGELRDFVATLSPDERGHFLPKAQGAEQGELAWYFVGRRQESAEIARWLHTAREGMFVVTGQAGSGKSALLGNVVVQTNPELSALLARAGMGDSTGFDDVPPPHVFDAVLHLTGATTGEVVQQLAAALGPDTAIEDAERLAEVLKDRQAPFTVLADALDEAQDPLAVARGTLARIAGIDGVRVLVGTRSSTKEGPDSPADGDQDILDALGGTGRRIVVGADRAAAEEYVRRRLLAAFPDAAEAELDSVCQEIGSRERHFLYARLAVHELIARPELMTAGHRGQRLDLLAQDYRAIFAAAVARLSRRNQAFAPLLEALALSQGRGLPRTDGVWPVAARALRDVHDVRSAIDEQSMDELLADAAPYIMLDAEHGQSVYRLAHRTFQEHYFSPETALRHRLVAAALAESAEAALPSLPNPYLVHHLPAHHAEADAWQLLAERPRLLDHLAPAAISVQAVRPRPGGVPLPDAISAIRAAHHRLSALAPDQRGALRAVAEAQFTGRLPDSSGWLSPEADWQPLWAEFKRLRSPGTSVFTVDCEHLTILTAITWVDGRTVVVLADADLDPDADLDLDLETASARIHIWDPVLRTPVGEPWAVPGWPLISALAAVPTDQGYDHVAMGNAAGVEIWDPVTRERTHAFGPGPAGAVDRLATVTAPDGRTRLVYGDNVTSRLIGVRDLDADHEVTVDIQGDLGDMIGVRVEDGSSLLVIAGSGYTNERIPPGLALPDAPVPVVVIPGEAERITAVPGVTGQVVLAPTSVHRRPLSWWDSASGVRTELPVTVDLAYDGSFCLTRSPGGELLLISITGKGRTVTVTEMPALAPHDEVLPPFQGRPRACAVRLPGHGDAFAIRSADGEFGFYEASTGDLIGATEVPVDVVVGPAGGPLLIQDELLQWSVWTETEGYMPLAKQSPLSMDAVPFLDRDGHTVIAHKVGRSVRKFTVWPPGAGRWRRWAAAWKRRPSWQLDHDSVGHMRALTKPGGGALILFDEGTTGSIFVLDSDRPGDAWTLPPSKTRVYDAAALLHLPEPVLATCESRSVLLWDLVSRTQIGTLDDHSDIIGDMTEVHAGPPGQERALLAVAHLDGTLRLWDPSRPGEPLAVLDLDMAAYAIVSAGTKLCLANEEGVLCIDIGGIVCP
ncbi:AAA family ATPase [Streptomyces phaeochromogenes]|uniref:AAA family ATPase n=1 Tax=Streptomyces phaeochromogenes TaxID=1923 RepID=A0ABZ1HI72_STRPH|nr:hypothetical protein [Streptomyces phaeochromogenes]WSD17769.1 AAA family ATPase [Streptomyces phaeochromogenes]